MSSVSKENRTQSPCNVRLANSLGKVPPPVKPKTFRNFKTEPLQTADQNTCNDVYICVTEDTTGATDDMYNEMEKKLDQAKQEKDALLQQIVKLKGEVQEYQKEVKKAYNKLDHYSTVSRSKKVQDRLRYWSQSRPSISDLSKPMPHDELADPQEMIQQFIESERLYLNCLEAVDFHFLQPMKMFSIFKCDILSSQQFQALFLNSHQLLVIHKLFYQRLSQLRNLPKEARLEEFVILLESFTPSFSLYAGFQSEHYMVNLQRELGHIQAKPQFGLLLEDLNKKCEGKTLVDLLRIIAGRLSEYQTLLSGFLEERLKGTRGMKEGIIKRLEGVKRFLDTIHLEIFHEKDWWDCIVDKMKVLNRVSPTSPIPMDIFHPATRLIKQGQVNIVVKGKELQRQLFLFSSHLAMAEKLSDQKFYFAEDAMKSLTGATVFSIIDTAGQAIEPDFHSGLKEDMLGFRVNLSQDSLVIRVGKPNEKKSWLECIGKAVQMVQTGELAESDEVLEAIIPDEAPQIAAASLEKLFQQLTNPQIPYKEEFIEIFLNTFQCFTTPKNVLTALINCIRSPDKQKASNQSSHNSTSDIFMFNMEDGIETESSISASNSIQNISDYDSDCSLSDSPIISRRMTGSSTSSSAVPSSRRPSKIKNSKIKEEARISGGGATTDSDSSPYTSGVPIGDNINKEVELGWNDSSAEMSLIGHHQRLPGGAGGVNGRYHHGPSSVHSNYSQDDFSSVRGSDEDSEAAAANKSFSRSVDDLLSKTDSLFQRVQETFKITQQPEARLSRTFDDFVLVNYTTPPMSMSSLQNSPEKSSNRQSKVLENDFLPRKEDDDCFISELDDTTYKMRSRKSDDETPSPSRGANHRYSISNSLSFSEPDLVVCAIKNERESLIDGVNYKPEEKEEDELLTSLPPTIARKFVDIPLTPQHHAKPHKQKQGGRFKLMGKKKKKNEERKCESLGVSDRRHTLNPSSSLYFNNSSNSVKDQVRSSPSKGFSGIFKKKDKEGKRLQKSPSMYEETTDGPIPETPRRRTARSSSLAPTIENRVYMNIDDFGKPRMMTQDDVLSPSLQRKLSNNAKSYKNFNLASKVFLILGRWIETHFEDFQNDSEMMEMLEDFLSSMQASECIGESKLAEQLFTVTNLFKMKPPRDQNLFTETMVSASTDLMSSGDWGKPSRILGYKVIDLGKSSNLKDPGFIRSFAEQITMFKYSCYFSITRRELLNCNWKKKEREMLSPNVCKLIQQTNEMTSWISTEVLQQDTPSARAIVIEHFIAMAMVCYKHHDMHCALTITVALNSTAVKRLTKTWDMVDKRTRQKFEKLKDVSDPQEKCKKLREKIERLTASEIEKSGRVPSCLPYLGAYLDLIYCLDIGVKTYNTDGLVNFTKMTKLSSLIDSFLQYQLSPYTFEPRQEIVSYILSAKRLSENELYDLSVKKEPSKQR